MAIHDVTQKGLLMKLSRIALAATLLSLATTSMAQDPTAYFDSVKVATVGAAQSSIPAMVAIGTVFIVIAIIVGLLMRSRSMGKSR